MRHGEMNLVRNERAKLLATYLNGMAIAATAIGGFSQFVASGAFGGALVPWIALSLVLHVAAQAILGRLRE